MKVIDFINIFNDLTEDQKQFELVIEFRTPNSESSYDDEYELTHFRIEKILESFGCVTMTGR